MNGAAPYLIVGVTAGVIALALIPFALLAAVLAASKQADVELGYDEASEPQPASIDRALVHYQAAYREALEEARVALYEQHLDCLPDPLEVPLLDSLEVAYSLPAFDPERAL